MAEVNKYLAAIIRHERAKHAVDALTREIGASIEACPITIKSNDPTLSNAERAQLWDEVKGKNKTHLWQAFQIRETSSCGWRSVSLNEDSILDALSEGGDFECEHCYHAYTKIIERRQAKSELGSARRAIRSLGRAALKEADHV